jgi:DNA polymerase III subunit delta
LILHAIDELDRELQIHSESNIFLVTGSEEYLCRQALYLIQHRVVSEAVRAFDYSEFDAREASPGEIREAANTFPMISKRRLVVVVGVDKLNEANESALLELLPDLSKKTVLVFLAPELDKRKHFYKQLMAKVCIVEFSQLKTNELERWAQEYIRKQGIRISSSALKEIVDLAGSDLQSLANEIDKLILYAGKDKSIPDSAISLMLSGSRQHKIFDLTDALGARNTRRALELLQNILDMGEHPLVVVNTMARQFRQLLIVKDLLDKGTPTDQIRAALQVQAFIADKLLRQARSIETKLAKQMYLRLADADLKFKSSRADHRMILESLICNLQSSSS